MSDIERPDVIGATRRAATIRAGMVGYVEAMAAIGEAYEQRDWVTLGHKDWDTYCEKEFSEKRLKLSREEREQAVLAFRGAGMSTRAIASALGVSQTTVQNDLGSGEQKNSPGAVLGADGKTYAATKPAAEAEEPEAPADSPPSSEPTVEEEGVAARESSSAPAATRLDAKPTAKPESKPEPWRDSDPTVVEAERRRRVSRSFSEGLMFTWMALDPDPVAWLGRSWDPAANMFGDVPTAQHVFTPDGLRKVAAHLAALAEHLDEKGESLL